MATVKNLAHTVHGNQNCSGDILHTSVDIVLGLIPDPLGTLSPLPKEATVISILHQDFLSFFQLYFLSVPMSVHQQLFLLMYIEMLFQNVQYLITNISRIGWNSESGNISYVCRTEHQLFICYAIKYCNTYMHTKTSRNYLCIIIILWEEIESTNCKYNNCLQYPDNIYYFCFINFIFTFIHTYVKKSRCCSKNTVQYEALLKTQSHLPSLKGNIHSIFI